MMTNSPDKYLTCLLLLITAFFIAPVKASGQEKEVPKELYTAAGIPDSLKEDANSVVRYAYDEITVKSPEELILKHHQLVTILNEKGDREAIIQLFYNKKYDTFSDIDIRAYNANGVLLKKYHKGDMYDGAAISDETIVTDERFLGLQHTVASYPTTIEVQYEEDLSSFINMPTWEIQEIEQSIQNETFTVIVNHGLGFRYLPKNMSIYPAKTTTGNFDTYIWQVANKKAFKLEDGAMPWRVVPKVEFAVNKFDCYGYPGDLSSWQNLGKWIYGLNSDVSTLSPERAAEIRKMTDTIKTDRDKAKFLYVYLQQSMRYVSVQLGIGGYKPFAASFVDQKKYGDCKALANYMYALLKAANIPSYWAVIRGGVNEFSADPDFPNNPFNHEILCIPFKNDTTWLDCTDAYAPFGKLASFTENRNALLITEDGGKLVNTPKSTMDDNQFNSEAHIVLDADGGAKAQVKILCTGVYRYDYIGISALKTDEQKEQIMHNLNIRQPSVFDYNPMTDKNGIKEVDMNLEYDKFCDIIAGDKQFYRPHVFDLCAFTVPVMEKRKSDYFFDAPLQKTCVTTIDLPAGFEVETLPANQSLKFTYGNYEVKYVYDAAKNEVISTAKFDITNQVIPAAKYTELQEYLDAVAKAQNKKLVIRHKA